MTTDLILYTPAADAPPDAEFPETLAGGHALVLEYAPGHALVVEYGDCSFGMHCECGHTVAYDLRPDRSWVEPLLAWLAHVPDVRPQVTPHCQCGNLLGKPVMAAYTPAKLERVARAWEAHTVAACRV